MLQDDSNKETRKDSQDNVAGPSINNRECIREVGDILEKFVFGKRDEMGFTKALSEFRQHLISCPCCEETVNVLKKKKRREGEKEEGEEEGEEEEGMLQLSIAEATIEDDSKS